MSIDTVLAELKRGANEILIEDELRERLRKGKRLRIKATPWLVQYEYWLFEFWRNLNQRKKSINFMMLDQKSFSF